MVVNHPVDYISTHPFLFWDTACWEGFPKWEERQFLPDNRARSYVEGVNPNRPFDVKRVTIGNDVWLGRNVIITNYANIGDGVIAGAGAVITKDIPDYAVVAGVPARIVRYRYSAEQIDALKHIRWWDWPDEKIVDCYDDFYEPIDFFISKYKDYE